MKENALTKNARLRAQLHMPPLALGRQIAGLALGGDQPRDADGKFASGGGGSGGGGGGTKEKHGKQLPSADKNSVDTRPTSARLQSHGSVIVDAILNNIDSVDDSLVVTAMNAKRAAHDGKAMTRPELNIAKESLMNALDTVGRGSTREATIVKALKAVQGESAYVEQSAAPKASSTKPKQVEDASHEVPKELVKFVPKGLDKSQAGKEITIKKGGIAFDIGNKKSSSPKYQTNETVKLKSLGTEIRGSGEYQHVTHVAVLPAHLAGGKAKLLQVADKHLE